MNHKPYEKDQLEPEVKVDLIEKIWAKVRKKHLFPEIPKPILKKGDEKVALEIKDKQIFISNDFYLKMLEKMEGEKIIEALFDHGVTHYTYCPWNFDTYLSLYYEAKKVTKDNTLAQRATSLFMDVVADTHIMSRIDSPLSLLYKNMEKTGLDYLMLSLYQKIWDTDLDSGGYEGEIRRLQRIPYLDKGRWTESIKKFIRGIKHLLEAEEEGSDKKGILGNHTLDNYSKEEIEEGLRNFADRTQNIMEFKEVVEDFEEQLKELGYGEGGGMGRGKGSKIDADILFYRKLAENFSMPIREMPIRKSGFMNPYSHSPWELGKPVRDIDVWTSFGKILPGITQVWERREGENYGLKEGTPDCMIIIDSSGSMTNPRNNLSYAVLGAACAAEAYLKNSSKVAVYNFSDAPSGGKEFLGFTREKYKIYMSLCRYFGGGTALVLEDLGPVLNISKVPPDIFLITDMQITNLESLIEYIDKLNNRITAVHIGENRSVHRFKESMLSKKNVSVFSVTKKEDIPRIVLGKIRDYFSETSFSS